METVWKREEEEEGTSSGRVIALEKRSGGSSVSLETEPRGRRSSPRRTECNAWRQQAAAQKDRGDVGCWPGPQQPDQLAVFVASRQPPHAIQPAL